MAHLLRHRKLSEGVTLLLDERLTAILRTHAAVSVIGHGLVRGAGLGGPLGAALNSVKAVSGSAYRVTIPAVLHIACLRQCSSRRQTPRKLVKNTPPDHRQPISASLLCRAPPPSRGVMLPFLMIILRNYGQH